MAGMAGTNFKEKLMAIPQIYAQSVDGLENFEASGDDLAVTRHFTQITDQLEEGTDEPA